MDTDLSTHDGEWCLSGLWDGLKPTPILSVSEWADAHRYLSASSEKGRWRTDRTPYLKEILDNLSPTSPYNEVVVMKAVQLGFTESGLNAVGCYVDIAPCPILYVMPTIDMAKGISTERIDPMIDATPRLSSKIRPARERDSGNTVLRKNFPGGVLVLAGANSGSSLRSRPIRLLILDEIDAYPPSINNEGSPIALAEKRTVTFYNRKIYKLSTPTVDGASAIQKEVDNTDKRKYFVPLPCCGVFQPLEFECLVWEKSDYKNVKYKCPHCGGLTAERFKTAFLKNGEWRATDPGLSSKERVGYLINGLYSPVGWMSWSSIAREYDESQGDDIKTQAFVNTVLGETYKEKGDAPEWDALYSRRENYPTYRPPAKVVFLTAGCDVQKDRLELEIVGWCKDLQSYSIDYRVIPGDTSSTGPGSVWETLGKLMQEQWQREDGRILMIRKLAVDSGFNTSEVYNFCFSQDISRVSAVKGRESLNMAVAAPRPVTFKFNGKPIKFNALWTVGTSFLKAEIYGKLKLKVNEDQSFPPWYCHFPSAYEPYYFRMLTAEHLQKRIVRGFAVYEWVKSFARNEALDCRIYARAAMAMLGAERWSDADWTIIEKSNDIGPGEKPIRKTNKAPKSSFWNR